MAKRVKILQHLDFTSGSTTNLLGKEEVTNKEI